LVNGDELIVPCSAAPPARFNRFTGKLVHFQPPSAGRKPGGWFASLDNVDPAKAQAVRRGELAYDSEISGDRHEDRQMRGEGVKGVRSRVVAGDRVLEFAKPPAGVEGTVYAMAVAQGMLFVSTVEGRVYALGKGDGPTTEHKQTQIPLPPADTTTQAKAKFILKQTKVDRGLALVLGATDGKLIEALIAQSPLRFLVVESDIDVANRLRQRWDRAGIYGSRVIVRCEDPVAFTPPHYVASLILCEDPQAAGFGENLKSLGNTLNALRPFGGIALLAGDVKVDAPAGALISSSDRWTMVSRRGALPGTTNYAARWQQSGDELVRAPLGVLWFDDAIGHFKRSPQPLFIDGVMVSQPKDWSNLDERPYPLMPATYTDDYTGRRITPDE